MVRVEHPADVTLTGMHFIVEGWLQTHPPLGSLCFSNISFFLSLRRCLQKVQPECLPCAFSPQASISWADNHSPRGPSGSCCRFQPLLCTQIAAAPRSALGCLDGRINLTTAAWSLIKPGEVKIFSSKNTTTTPTHLSYERTSRTGVLIET